MCSAGPYWRLMGGGLFTGASVRGGNEVRLSFSLPQTCGCGRDALVSLRRATPRGTSAAAIGVPGGTGVSAIHLMRESNRGGLKGGDEMSTTRNICVRRRERLWTAGCGSVGYPDCAGRYRATSRSYSLPRAAARTEGRYGVKKAHRTPLMCAGSIRKVVLQTLTRGEKMLGDGSRYAATLNSL